jgi:hypothetical protein
MRSKPYTYVRDFARGETIDDEIGDWIISNSIIQSETSNAPLPSPTWNNGYLTQAIEPGFLMTYQAVVLPPVADGYPSPQLGSVLITDIECNIFDVTPFQTACTSESGSITPASPGSVVVPSFTTTLTATSTPTLPDPVVATPTIIPWTGTIARQPSSVVGSLVSDSSSDVLNLPTLNTLNHACFGGSFQQTVAISLYVSQFNSSTGFWDVRDILLDSNALRSDILDYAIDVYRPPYLAYSYASRKWTVSLPYPIIIGKGQALHVSLSTVSPSFANPVYLQAYIRTLVKRVA